MLLNRSGKVRYVQEKQRNAKSLKYNEKHFF